MKPNQKLIYVISKPALILLFTYYSALLLGGLGMLIYVGRLLAMNNFVLQSLLLTTFFASLAASAMLCSIQYIKRLYKACITNRILKEGENFEKLGNIVYFATRPLFAMAFSVFMVFSALSGMYVVTGNLDYIINEKFLYLCVILSGTIGYSIGRVLDRFEQISANKIKQIQ